MTNKYRQCLTNGLFTDYITLQVSRINVQVHVFQMHNHFDCVVSSLMYFPMYALTLDLAYLDILDSNFRLQYQKPKTQLFNGDIIVTEKKFWIIGII